MQQTYVLLKVDYENFNKSSQADGGIKLWEFSNLSETDSVPYSGCYWRLGALLSGIYTSVAAKDSRHEYDDQ
jgi:hypothetical protein